MIHCQSAQSNKNRPKKRNKVLLRSRQPNQHTSGGNKRPSAKCKQRRGALDPGEGRGAPPPALRDPGLGSSKQCPETGLRTPCAARPALESSKPHRGNRTRTLGFATVTSWQAMDVCGDGAGEGDLDSPGRIWREVIVKLEGLVREGLGGVQQEGGGPRRALEPALTVRHAVTKETERRCSEPGSATAMQQRPEQSMPA